MWTELDTEIRTQKNQWSVPLNDSEREGLSFYTECYFKEIHLHGSPGEGVRSSPGCAAQVRKGWRVSDGWKFKLNCNRVRYEMLAMGSCV